LVALLAAPAQEVIETSAEILECQLDWIGCGEGFLVDGAGEETCGLIARRRDLEYRFQQAPRIIYRECFPGRFTSRKNGGSVEFDIFRILVKWRREFGSGPPQE